MAQHLKSIVKKGIKGYLGRLVPGSEVSASHARGVCYFEPIVAINMLWGTMNSVKEGRYYKKHIIVRRVPRCGGRLLQLYTYHFPKTWSAACVANRELIKEAQRRAHALEHDSSYEALEWRLRFFYHYFRVFRCGEQPEPGMKRYSRFYQYTYVAIYRQLTEEARKSQEEASCTFVPSSGQLPLTEDINFDPIDYRPLRAHRTYPLQRAIYANTCNDSLCRAPLWQDFCKIVT